MRVKETIIGAALVGALVGFASPHKLRGTPPVMQSAEERARIEQSVHYSGCNEVRDLGKDPIYAGQPGYREDMDGDSDGIACEPIHH